MSESIILSVPADCDAQMQLEYDNYINDLKDKWSWKYEIVEDGNTTTITQKPS